MLLDAIVLAGGRSSRLSGVPKAQLLWHGATLLQNTVDAALLGGARRVVVVGPDAPVPDAPGPDAPVPDARIRFTREDPPFGGPAAAIGAGMRAFDELEASAADAVLVLACDMPEIARVVTVLVESLPLAGFDGALLVDSSGMRQPLAAVYGRPALADAVEGLRASGTLDGASMRSLIASLDLRELTDAAGATSDVDTWPDAAAFGIDPPHDAPSPDEHPDEHPDEQRSRA
ncbi:NTP transferase domain-containing protein [Agreia sp. PsM10]|uniref:molybdenum cofactor guanylyltransferase n=1 Tax=Agreia sp. PsM10 TaxID=3030533 RepID=UPI00263B63E8|nr:NTP transferase domain-containing protein [Agreia sp. PsM10]MDN4640890.1 NTP transferase domain-containing protein [Agreia sp. PsM10]